MGGERWSNSVVGCQLLPLARPTPTYPERSRDHNQVPKIAQYHLPAAPTRISASEWKTEASGRVPSTRAISCGGRPDTLLEFPRMFAPATSRRPRSQALSARLPRTAVMSSEIARPQAHGKEYLQGRANVLGISSFAGFCRPCGPRNCRESWNGLFVVGEESASRSR